MPLPTELLELLADTKEVLIETRSSEDVTRTFIWVGASDDMVYVRSARGESWLVVGLPMGHVVLGGVVFLIGS